MTFKTENRKLTGVCGLCCDACNAYITAMKQPERLSAISRYFRINTEASVCYGWRPDKKGSYCSVCKVTSCAGETAIDFREGCSDYPCDDLKHFQAESLPQHELWESLSHIIAAGWESWMQETCDS